MVRNAQEEEGLTDLEANAQSVNITQSPPKPGGDCILRICDYADTFHNYPLSQWSGFY